jgi:RHH-type transcriptional regulator, proline utilization regulon repressor / proline dehydrogenase / delta 1-pyrroline-5-carboxylate dehydrogenase
MLDIVFAVHAINLVNHKLLKAQYSARLAFRRLRPFPLPTPYGEKAMTVNLHSFYHAISDACLADEARCVNELIEDLDSDSATQQQISTQAAIWIAIIRERYPVPHGVEALLLEYPLSKPEGIALMCLAEALLRIPDTATADQLIRDLLNPLAWERHVARSDSLFVNAASWGLALSGRWLHATEIPQGGHSDWLHRLVANLGEPVLRQALKQAMRYLANQFVLGETLPTALQRAAHDWQIGTTHSFDMLGEAALTAADSARYWQAYRDAIAALREVEVVPGVARPSLSIKLSALHPRYHSAHKERLWKDMAPQLCELIETAAADAIDVTIDAEEADRLELSLQLFAHVLQQISPVARAHVGLVVQAYGKRAWPVLKWLEALAQQFSIRIKLRLVKGAYWDSEIKRAQQRGLADYPVFTSKAATDVSYLACARWLLQRPTQFFPQFATHNAVTVAAILQMQSDTSRFEFQRLQGMGEILYRVVREQYPTLQLRIYAPVGDHHDLLPYLVRRLLENGANTSFMHHLHDNSIAIETLAAHPLQSYSAEKKLPLPAAIWPQRDNSPGIYLHSENFRTEFFAELEHARAKLYCADTTEKNNFSVTNPHNGEQVGFWRASTPGVIDTALQLACDHQSDWQQTSIETRAALLESYADLLIENRAELIALMARETGKTLENGIDEIREAIDFCRYYAQQARTLLSAQHLPGVVGEHNELHYCARGTFVCISPWNFPLAIFTGQIVAALVTGNAVIAKPAEQATLTAQFAIRLMHKAGIPETILHCMPGSGENVGRYLCAHTYVDGIVFTGGWETARSIQQQIAQRTGAMIPFIAETAGINALIADSSAQPQQLVNDVLRSAFDSAGQRCSALRVLLLPETSADTIEALLCGAMRELRLGDPLDWSTDIGPVIDANAKASLLNYLEQYREAIAFQLDVPPAGNFVAPTLLRLQRIDQLQREAFGPILHIVRYRESAIDQVVDDINALGYGLTCGIHSRNPHRAQQLSQKLRIGNIYVNRDIVGAVVGAQPFGGCGKSGTGPKAGGPNYLLRFVAEKTITTNIAAIGGDYDLLTK